MRKLYIAHEISKIQRAIPDANAKIIGGFKYFDKEMSGLQMSLKQYLLLIKLRNFTLRIALNKTLRIYFPRIIQKLDELSLRSSVVDCFVFIAESLECIENKINYWYFSRWPGDCSRKHFFGSVQFSHVGFVCKMLNLNGQAWFMICVCEYFFYKMLILYFGLISSLFFRQGRRFFSTFVYCLMKGNFLWFPLTEEVYR